MSIVSIELATRTTPELSILPSLPSTGWAGMYAGTSNGALFCMGGTNFLDKKPWEGGKRNVSKDIYMLLDGYSDWIKLNDELEYPMAYGVSASYKNKIFLVGGTVGDEISSQAISLEWDGSKLNKQIYPNFPFQIAYMCGTIVDDLLIVAGGMDATGNLSKKCFALNLLDAKSDWFPLPDIPGRERMLPVCASSNSKFFLFSGETKTANLYGEKYRDILQDAYSLDLSKIKECTALAWQTLAAMPKGISAGPSPAPVLDDESVFLWGGVDAVVALHKSPSTHPGISSEAFKYYPNEDRWGFIGAIEEEVAKATLPAVYWQNQWVYVSGETKPGVRANSVISIRSNLK